MRICYDHQTFTNQKVGGISRYFKYLIDGLDKSNEDEALLALLYSENVYLEDKDFPSKLRKLKVLFNKQKKIVKRNSSHAKKIIARGDYDIFHPTYFDPYYLQLNKKPTVLTVHDMTYEALPNLFPITDATPQNKRLTTEKATKIIAISEQTKADILTYTNIPEEKIEVIYHGICQEKPIYHEIKNLPKNYLLFVGGRWSYKNFFLLIDAFAEIRRKNNDLHLILAGGGNLAYGDTEYLIRKKVIDYTTHINPTDFELNTLYKNASCFIYPSSYEGFGFPILEAFKNNCPTLLSNINCFKEVASNAAYYFDNGNLESLINAITTIISNSSSKTEKQNLAEVQLRKFNIEGCVEKTLNLYRQLC